MKVKSFLLLLILAGCVFLSYSNVIHGEFQFDDDIYISGNPSIGNMAALLPDSLSGFFFGNRKLTTLTFGINYAIGGLAVEGYHITNIFIHLLTVCMVYFFARKVFSNLEAKDCRTDRAGYPALLVAAIFALHPVQTEAVSYIVQRSEALASILYLASLYCFIFFTESGGRRSIVFGFLGSALYVIGLGFKEIIATMPAALVLYVVFLTDGKRLRRAFLGIAPILVLGLFAGGRLVLASTGSKDVGFGIPGLGVQEYLLTQFRVLVTYIRLLFLPFGQNLDYDYAIYRSISDPAVLFSLIFWVGAAAFSFYTLKLRGRRSGELRLIAFGVLWFLLVLSPTSSVVPIRDVIFEHRLYLPMIGIAFSAVTIGSLVFSKLSDKSGLKNGLIALTALALIALPLLTYRRNAVWETKMSLWQDAARKSSGKSRVRNNLGNCYYLAGNDIAALSEYKKAAELDPNNIPVYYNLNLVFTRLGKPDAARYYLDIFKSRAHSNIK